MATIIIPLPDRDFDVTECVVPWEVLGAAGHTVHFATETGATPACDPLLLTGVVFGQLGAKPENVTLYRRLERAPEFLNPVAYDAINPDDYDLLVLPGGHASGMKQFLESETLRAGVRAFFDADAPVAAICHGVVVLARTLGADGRSVIAGRKVTALTRVMEGSAYYLTFWKHGKYYRTYPEYVESEVRRAVGDDGQFFRGPLVPSYAAPFAVRERNLLTARWPGDAALFSKMALDLLPS